MKNLWFKAKRYGWGWYPVTWQGWLILAIYTVIILWNFKDIDAKSHSASDTVFGVLPRVIIAIGILIWICYKTGEKPRWRWGK